MDFRRHADIIGSRSVVNGSLNNFSVIPGTAIYLPFTLQRIVLIRQILLQHVPVAKESARGHYHRFGFDGVVCIRDFVMGFYSNDCALIIRDQLGGFRLQHIVTAQALELFDQAIKVSCDFAPFVRFKVPLEFHFVPVLWRKSRFGIKIKDNALFQSQPVKSFSGLGKEKIQHFLFRVAFRILPPGFV
ncbi:hypothetical protein SDC9_179382 [bioreactor metagenome]|uniref:Uncharacterized protein n=1 Tax=bioreactor metagenome TaxID=1076179 RepID=A0A645GYS3_9ZZZZ